MPVLRRGCHPAGSESVQVQLDRMSLMSPAQSGSIHHLLMLVHKLTQQIGFYELLVLRVLQIKSYFALISMNISETFAYIFF